jgi:hypothetical protein
MHGEREREGRERPHLFFNFQVFTKVMKTYRFFGIAGVIQGKNNEKLTISKFYLYEVICFSNYLFPSTHINFRITIVFSVLIL